MFSNNTIQPTAPVMVEIPVFVFLDYVTTCWTLRCFVFAESLHWIFQSWSGGGRYVVVFIMDRSQLVLTPVELSQRCALLEELRAVVVSILTGRISPVTLTVRNNNIDSRYCYYYNDDAFKNYKINNTSIVRFYRYDMLTWKDLRFPTNNWAVTHWLKFSKNTLVMRWPAITCTTTKITSFGWNVSRSTLNSHLNRCIWFEYAIIF